MTPMTLSMPRLRRPLQAGVLVRWSLQAALSAAMAIALLPQPASARTPSKEDGVAGTTSLSTAAAVGGNRLKVGTLVEFDPRRGNVGDAINFVLEPVRYRLTHRTVDPLVSAAVLRRPIPPVAANAGVMSIEAALLLLIGDEHRLVVDHAHRLIAIERMPQEAGAQTP